MMPKNMFCPPLEPFSASVNPEQTHSPNEKPPLARGSLALFYFFTKERCLRARGFAWASWGRFYSYRYAKDSNLPFIVKYKKFAGGSTLGSRRLHICNSFLE